MAQVGKFYSKFFEKALSKEIGWVSDTIRCALCTGDYIPNQATDVYFSDITNEAEASGGYIAGGFELSNRVIEYDSSMGSTRLKADSISLQDVTIPNVRHIVIYKDSGTPSTSPLIGFIDLGVVRGVTNGVFEINWNEDGVFTNTITV